MKTFLSLWFFIGCIGILAMMLLNLLTESSWLPYLTATAVIALLLSALWHAYRKIDALEQELKTMKEPASAEEKSAEN